ncbi:integrase [Catenuloplanes nepalensis]|uniref:Integrase n=1 Tax=Catenuloplanes nepalensis TaxID=587533 RepID=A0ABT9N5V5_9ACTN|nr:tyrosine-type recombinase/integrase [Catenuloplanes nepalensis]MDP9798903.1 integrase [Catenuloplanes nepalensis]
MLRPGAAHTEIPRWQPYGAAAGFLVSMLIDVRDALDDTPGADQLVFPNGAGTPLLRSNFRRRVWTPALRRAGLPTTLRFHDLRHSYATWLVSDGVPINAVQRVMGHAQASTTLNRYTHAPVDYEARVRGALDAVADFPLTLGPDDGPDGEDDETDAG